MPVEQLVTYRAKCDNCDIWLRDDQWCWLETLRREAKQRGWLWGKSLLCPVCFNKDLYCE